MNLSKEHDRKGLVATIFIHTIIFLLMLVWVMAEADDMVDQAGGVEVSFGEPDAGGPEDISQSAEDMAESTPEPSPPVNTPDADQMVTQDVEDAPEVKATNQTTTDNTTKEPVQEKPKEQPKPTIDKGLQDRLKKIGKGKKNSETTTSTGGGKKTGPLGDRDADQAGKGGKSTGTMGNFSFSLTGFTVSHAPTIKNESQDDGTVIIQVCLDHSGNIKSVNKVGGTSTSIYLKNLSINAVKKFKFQAIGDRSETNCGTISFNYALH
jgi:outer membrane biosynthesis protein TonB